MQIKNYVTQYDIQDQTSFKAEMVTLHVEYESLRAVHDDVKISHRPRLQQIQGQDNMQFSLIDPAPSILRDLCAGLCFWTSVHGQELLRHHPHNLIRFKLCPSQKGMEGDQTDLRQHHINN